MCSPGDTVPVRVRVLAHLAHEGVDIWKVKPIDRCIAPAVEILQSMGYDMLGSCCGHGKRPGEILLADVHPETFCHRCGQRNVRSWYADDDLWNEATKDPEQGAAAAASCSNSRTRTPGPPSSSGRTPLRKPGTSRWRQTCGRWVQEHVDAYNAERMAR